MSKSYYNYKSPAKKTAKSTKSKEPADEKPKTTRKAWTEIEDSALANFLSKDMSRAEIAVKLERSEQSIATRILKLAVDMYNRKLTIVEILAATKITEEELTAEISRLEKVEINDVKENPADLKKQISKLENKIDILTEKLTIFMDRFDIVDEETDDE